MKREFNEDHTPLAYLITFRSYGTWLHGDKRGSVDRKPANEPQPVRVDVDHRFARTSVLRYQTYVYNAARNEVGPDVWIDARVLRGSQQVMIVAPSKIPPDVSPDSWRLPYWSEISLNQLPRGAYTLQVSASDKVSGASTSQRVVFTIE